VAINDDKAEAVQDARATVAFYAGLAQYTEIFTEHGFGKEAAACAAAVERKDMAGAIEAVTPEMAQTFVMCGSVDEVRKTVEKVWDVADSYTLCGPLVGLPMDKVLGYITRIAETFYS
jgi:hypothetical protein